MTRRLKKVFAVTLVLCLALVAMGFFSAQIAANRGEKATTVVSTTPTPAANASGTVTVSVTVVRVIRINSNGTVRSNTHAVMQKGDHASTAISP